MARSVKYNNVPTIDTKIFDRICAAVPELGEIEVVAGVLAERYGNDPVEGTTLTYGQLLTIQEYGSRHIPPRPVIEPVTDAATTHNTISKMVTAGLAGLVKRAATGAQRIKVGEKLLNDIGLYLVDQMKARIRAGIAPALSERTIRARERAGRSGVTPLFDTKHLINAITHAVRPRSGAK